MNLFKRTIISQFGHPRGLRGRLAGRIMVRQNAERTTWAVGLLNVQPDDHVLEIGFGPGLAIQHVAQIAIKGFVAGIDHSTLMVEQARQRNAAAIQAGRVELRQGSALSLPYEHGAFDKVFTINTLHHIPEPDKALAEMIRVLRPGGRVAIISQNRWVRSEADIRQAADEIAAQLTAAGCDSVRLEFKSMEPVPTICALGTTASNV